MDTPPANRPEEELAVHDALELKDAQCAQLVKLHYFIGFTLEEAPEFLGVCRSKATVGGFLPSMAPIQH